MTHDSVVAAGQHGLGTPRWASMQMGADEPSSARHPCQIKLPPRGQRSWLPLQYAGRGNLSQATSPVLGSPSRRQSHQPGLSDGMLTRFTPQKTGHFEKLHTFARQKQHRDDGSDPLPGLLVRTNRNVGVLPHRETPTACPRSELSAFSAQSAGPPAHPRTVTGPGQEKRERAASPPRAPAQRQGGRSAWPHS